MVGIRQLLAHSPRPCGTVALPVGPEAGPHASRGPQRTKTSRDLIRWTAVVRTRIHGGVRAVASRDAPPSPDSPGWARRIKSSFADSASAEGHQGVVFCVFRRPRPQFGRWSARGLGLPLVRSRPGKSLRRWSRPVKYRDTSPGSRRCLCPSHSTERAACSPRHSPPGASPPGSPLRP